MSVFNEEFDVEPLSQSYILMLAAKAIQDKLDEVYADRKKLTEIHDVDAYNAANSILDAKVDRLNGHLRTVQKSYVEELDKAKDTQGTWLNKD
jgi:hypothetical protein